MRRTRIHYEGELTEGGLIELDDAASAHLLRVLRLKAGAAVIVFNGQGGEFEAVIDERDDRRRARLRIGARRDPAVESPLAITLAQGISRGERMDWTLQKSVELGVTRIVALTTAFSQVRLDAARLERRIAHWNGVIRGACEQSGRTAVPSLTAGLTLAQWLSETEVMGQKNEAGTDAPLRLVLDPRAEQGPGAISARPREVILLAGPEGGLGDDEVAAAIAAGFTGLRLGPRILRTETAGIAALAALQTLWGDLS